jgi:hypothetical protein
VSGQGGRLTCNPAGGAVDYRVLWGVVPTEMIALPGNGRGGFGRPTTIVAEQQGFDVGELDGDGRLDVVTAYQGQLHAWGQTAAGQFVERWSGPSEGISAPIVDDVTGDGLAEVVTGGDLSGITVLSGVYGGQIGGVPGVIWPPILLATGDVDGDGVHDIVSLDGYSGGVGFSHTWAGQSTAQQYVWANPGLTPGCWPSGTAACWSPT